MDRALVPFQDKVVEHLINVCKGRGLVIVDMGLGKTPIACKVGVTLLCRRWLIICGENAVNVWRGNDSVDPGAVWWIEYWTKMKVHVHIMDDTPWNRKVDWNKATPQEELHIYIVVYNTFARDMGVEAKTKKKATHKPLERILMPKQAFDLVICDEATRMRNKKSALFRALRTLATGMKFKYWLPMTGTPSQRGPQDLWTMLNICDRRKFGSYWGLVDTFCDTIADPWGGVEILGPKKSAMPAFHSLLREHGVVIKETDPGIAEQRPPLTRQLRPIHLDRDQQKLYKEFKEDMMSLIGDKLLYAQNSMVQFLRMRQILICPQLLDPSLSPGQAIRDFVDSVESGEISLPVVIATPFTKVFPFFRNYIHEKLKVPKDDIIELESGISPQAQQERIQRYRRNKGICLLSILYAQAFSLEPATKGFMIGYDWDPNNNRQAEKRLHRLTTQNPINWYYYTYYQTVDYGMCKTLNIKQDAIDLTIPDNLLALEQEPS